MSAPAACPWPRTPLDRAYHDSEWGVPLQDDQALFELLTLEGAQAGLSWSIVLAKREGYRAAFEGFNVARVASYGPSEIERLVRDARIVRHRGKIEATIGNARALLALQREHGSFARYLWAFVDRKPIVNRWRAMAEIPNRSSVSDTLSADLKRRGFKFVGSTICHAFMQANGMINDHLISCPRHQACQRLAP